MSGVRDEGSLAGHVILRNELLRAAREGLTKHALLLCSDMTADCVP